MLLRDVPRKIRLNSPVRIWKLKIAGYCDGRGQVAKVDESGAPDSTYVGRLSNACKIRLELESDACAHMAAKYIPSLLKDKTDYETAYQRYVKVLGVRDMQREAARCEMHDGDEGVSAHCLEKRKETRAAKSSAAASAEAAALVLQMDQIAKQAVDHGLYDLFALEGALLRQLNEQVKIYRSDALVYARSLQRKCGYSGEVVMPPVHSDCLKRYRQVIPSFDFAKHMPLMNESSAVNAEQAKTLSIEEVPDVF